MLQIKKKDAFTHVYSTRIQNFGGPHFSAHASLLWCPDFAWTNMPDNRRIQGPEDSQNPTFFLKADEKQSKPDLVKIIKCIIIIIIELFFVYSWM